MVDCMSKIVGKGKAILKRLRKLKVFPVKGDYNKAQLPEFIWINPSLQTQAQ